MIVCGTGHRPNKLTKNGQCKPYSDLQMIYLAGLASEQLHFQGATRVISGMALGWDQALAYAAAESGIPFTAAIPFVGQESKWPKESQKNYHAILGAADEIVTVTDGKYAPWKMQVRNEWMVDNSNRVLALWDGSDGGTANCVRYAKKVGKPVHNAWDRWLMW